MELGKIAESRAREFVNLLTQDILHQLPIQYKTPPGIYTCLKLLAERMPIPELQIVLFVAEHQPLKKALLVKTFQPMLGYSTIYRKINKMLINGILVKTSNTLSLNKEYATITLLSTIHKEIEQEI